MNNKIAYLFERKDYQSILNLYEEEIMMNNNIKFSDFKSENIYAIIFSLLYNNRFDDIDFVSLRLKKENIFSFSYAFLILCSYLKQLNIFKALSYISEIDTLQSSPLISILGEDESSYANVLSYGDIDAIPCLLLIILISSLDITKINSMDDVMINYFEMLDIVYQSSCDNQVIEYMMNMTKILLN